MTWGSSVNIVSDYILDDRSSSAEANDVSSSLCVKTNSEVHPHSYPVGTASFPGGKTTHPHLVPWLRMSRSYIASSP
jgi:hypothetical protein